MLEMNATPRRFLESEEEKRSDVYLIDTFVTGNQYLGGFGQQKSAWYHDLWKLAISKFSTYILWSRPLFANTFRICLGDTVVQRPSHQPGFFPMEPINSSGLFIKISSAIFQQIKSRHTALPTSFAK